AVLDGGRCTAGIESTVLRVRREGGVELLRPGSLSVERIEETLNESVLHAEPGSAGPLTSPGMLPRHYAPSRSLRLVSDLSEIPAAGTATVGLLAYEGDETCIRTEWNGRSAEGRLRSVEI